MTEILYGKPVADKLKEEIKERVAKLNERNLEPKLTVVRIGNNPNDISYERGILKNCDNLGIKTEVIEKDTDTTTEEMLKLFEELNANKEVSGILLFRPVPKHIDEEALRYAIDPDKDVDCMHPINLARVFESDFSKLVPATPMAAMKVMEYYGVELEGKNVVVVNRSLVFGRPISMMLLKENATPTICHSRTAELSKVTNEADVVIVAMGRARSLGKEYFNENSIIIDVGVSADKDGKIGGDADFDELSDYVKMITPVPRGVGSVTTTILLDQVVKACEILNK
ncbi:MAG: bifunctional 5,10-methylenetetrahydrofolate dehydrogenase/5,10-methenyltetrahydrofolate cyclohydrolase [Tissierellia bacterium]|nr:bifunctional 5,10-methylenetetrahydrofolate dehydrogenase/5,10-methenyltetrahydrofolate cyclohydrolase [Tissierellia bacterium]